MEAVIQFYLIGMVATVLVKIVDFRRHKKANSKEYIAWNAAIELFKDSLGDLRKTFGIPIGSLIAALIVSIWVLAYFLMYPVHIVKMALKLFKKKSA